MAGEIVVRQTLTSQLLNEIRNCGFTLNVQIDCSHNAHVRTLRPDRPGNPIIAKPIELDAELKAFADGAALATAIGKMQAARTTSELFQFYRALSELGLTAATSPQGLSALRSRSIKIEFPNFDATIVNLQAAPAPLDQAVQACSAATVAAFNQLPAHVRQSMGMYLRTQPGVFQLVGAREPNPRTAIP